MDVHSTPRPHLPAQWANQLTAWPATLPRPPLITDRQYGDTPLIRAAMGGHVEVVRELLKAGANKDAADKVRSEGWWRKRRGGLVSAPCLTLRTGQVSCFICAKAVAIDGAPALGGRCLCACGIRDKACLKGGASTLLRSTTTRVFDMRCVPNTSCVPLEGAPAIYT